MKHVLGHRRTNVAKSSARATHFLTIRRDHPLGRGNATGERETDNDVLIHLNTPVVEAATLKPLFEKVNRA
jgi:hypothetical protein